MNAPPGGPRWVVFRRREGVFGGDDDLKLNVRGGGPCPLVRRVVLENWLFGGRAVRGRATVPRGSTGR